MIMQAIVSNQKMVQVVIAAISPLEKNYLKI